MDGAPDKLAGIVEGGVLCARLIGAPVADICVVAGEAADAGVEATVHGAEGIAESPGGAEMSGAKERGAADETGAAPQPAAAPPGAGGGCKAIALRPFAEAITHAAGWDEG